MLTFVFVLLSISGWGAAILIRKDALKQAEMQRRLPSADSNEDVLGVLEASGAEIAPKLLVAAENLRPDADWLHNADAWTPNPVAWELFLQDLQTEKTDEDRLLVLAQWLLRGFRLTPTETVELVRLFETPAKRAEARNMMTESLAVGQ